MLDEAELAHAFAAQAEGALERAYRAYGAFLRSAARQVLGADGDAEDCVHDALMRVWSRQTYRTERGGLRAFLVVCVRNEAISRRRSALRSVEYERRAASDPVAGATSDTSAGAAERLTIRAALAMLPREQREVIELAYWGQYTQAEIAARLSVPLGTIKSRVSLGLRKLARQLVPDRENTTT